MIGSISLPFLIMATGTILFVYMSVVVMELRSAYEESFWKQALKIGGIIFTLMTLLFLGLDFVLIKHSDYPPFSVANEIQFIKNMGTIFRREDSAKAEIDKINNTLAEVRKLAKEKGPRTVLTMQFRHGKIEVLGDNSLSGDIIKQIGCTNISYFGLLMPIENLLVLNPDSIIVIYDYIGGDASLENQILLLKSYPYNQIPVVNSDHIGAMQYFNDLVATNVHTSDSIWKIYKAIYEPSI